MESAAVTLGRLSTKEKLASRRTNEEQDFEGAERPTLPYLVAVTFTMLLSGNWETGGVLEFLVDGRRIDYMKLARAPWSLLAFLFIAALDSRSPQSLTAFITSKRLLALLDERQVVATPISQTVYKLISELRKKVATTTVRRLTQDALTARRDFAAGVIQSTSGLGYRIGLPPGNLGLVIGGTEYTATSDLTLLHRRVDKGEVKGRPRGWQDCSPAGIG